MRRPGISAETAAEFTRHVASLLSLQLGNEGTDDGRTEGLPTVWEPLEISSYARLQKSKYALYVVTILAPETITQGWHF
jgi:hypothetical protein